MAGDLGQSDVGQLGVSSREEIGPAFDRPSPALDYGPAIVRHVSGDGPRCGCGKRSAVHIIEREGAQFDYFLCDSCSLGAAITWLAARRQARFGPAATREYEDTRGTK